MVTRPQSSCARSFIQTRCDKTQDVHAVGHSGAKQNHAGVCAGGVLGEVGNPFVEGQHDTLLAERSRHDQRVGCARQILVRNGICVVTDEAQMMCKSERQILVDLEFHLASSGINCSSCASSAA